jgi:hypothetical protein
MTPLIGIPRWRRLALLMAAASFALQVLGFSLPSLVICFRDGRPPQVEFFAASCSCREAARRADHPHDAPGSPCLETACTDIHLGAPAALTAAASRHRSPEGSGRRNLLNELPLSMTGVTIPRPACHSRGRPGAAAPPLLAVTFASSPLRC